MGGHLVSLLATLRSIAGIWHKVEFRNMKNSAITIVLIPLLLIIPGAFLGAVSWGMKVAVVQIGMWVSVVAALWLAWKRAAIGAELAALINAVYPVAERRRFTGDVREGAYDYIRLVAAILASEIAAGFIALWLPAHQNPAMALLVLPVTIAFVTYTIWQEGRFWWPTLVHWLTWFTLIASVFAVFLPRAAHEATNQSKTIDGYLATLLRGEASAQGIFLMAVIVVAIVLALSVRYREAVKPMAKLGIAALVIWWFLWGFGGNLIKGFAEPAVATSRSGDIRHLEVKLVGQNEWVRVAHLFIPCTPYKIGSGEVSDGWIKFADGGELRLGDAGPDDFGRRDPVALKGEGIAHIWLFDPGKSCRRS